MVVGDVLSSRYGASPDDRLVADAPASEPHSGGTFPRKL
jgi:hypothetical protein